MAEKISTKIDKKTGKEVNKPSVVVKANEANKKPHYTASPDAEPILVKKPVKKKKSAPVSKSDKKPVTAPKENYLQGDKTLYCEIKGIVATGRTTAIGFIVLAKSQAVLEERKSTKKDSYSHITRDKLRAAGILVADSNCLRFTLDQEFSSPSAAASVIHGGNANGLTAWQDADGKLLKDLL